MVKNLHMTTKKLTTYIDKLEVSLFQETDPATGFDRDVVLGLDIKKKQNLLHKFGVIRATENSIHLIDEIIWILGTHILQLYEDYPEIFDETNHCLGLVSTLQDELIQLKTKLSTDFEEKKLIGSSIQTILKYHLVDLIRTFIEQNDQNYTDQIYIVNAIDHAFKACLNYVDDYEFDKKSTLPLPEILSLKKLHSKGHLKRLNNQTANTVVKLLTTDHQTKEILTKNKKPWYYSRPKWLPISFKGLFSIGITASLAYILLFLMNHLGAIQHFASAFSISNPFIAAGLFSTLIILGISYITQLTPTNTITLSEFIFKSLKSFMTMLTCLLVLVHFFYPYNILNLVFFNLFRGLVSLAITSSLNILLTVFIYIIINQILTHFAEPEKNNNFPKTKSLRFSDFLLFRAPYRNYVWRFFQTKKNRQMLFFTTIITALIIGISLLKQEFVISVIYNVATIFSISSVMAMLAIVSLIIFASKLQDLVHLFKSKKLKKQTKFNASNIDKAGMICCFTAVMSYVLYIDFSLISNVFSIIGNIFNLQIGTVLLSSQFLLVGVLCVVPFLLPKELNLKEMFYKNPLLQAEHIFMELNEFYYLYGLRHPIIMMLFLGLFIVSFASFYNHFIPTIIADFAYTLAIALINTNVGTSLLAFTASLMIGNILIISYDSLTAGKRSYIAKLSRLWETYPLDVLVGVTLILGLLNLFILIPYIQTHLGTVAMIGSLSFVFKLAVITYDFYRDNSQKSFIASSLMMLLWPFIAIRQLMDRPSIDEFYFIARGLEKSIIFFLLTLLYDIPFKIFLRIGEVMLYAIFNIAITAAKNYGLDNVTMSLIHTKKSIFSYLDFFRCSAKTTIFANRSHYRIWHLILVVGFIWLSFHFISLGLGLAGSRVIFTPGNWFNPHNILYSIMYSKFVHSIIYIQLGWSIISALTLGLIRLTNLTHNDIDFRKFKDDLIERFTSLFLCTLMISLSCILLSALNFSFIPTVQLVFLAVSLMIQTMLCYSDYTDGLSKMMQHCFNVNKGTITSERISQEIIESPKKLISGSNPTPDESLGESSSLETGR